MLGSTYSNLTSINYRIPFIGTITGTVKTKSGAPVANVNISICHIDPTTGEDDSSLTYCPLTITQTDQRGIFSVDIRVSHPNWNSTMEQFRLTPSLVETLDDNEEVVHIFAPTDQIVTLTHRSIVTASFIDQTSITIRGNIRFDPDFVNNQFCPFSGVIVYLNTSSGTSNTTTDDQGNFYFSITRRDNATIYLENSWNNHTWIVNASLSSLSTPSPRLSSISYLQFDLPGNSYIYFLLLFLH